MKRIMLVLVLTVLLSSCGGGDGNNAPGNIAGSWFGTGYIGGYYVEILQTFQPLQEGYYSLSARYYCPALGTQISEYTVYYENGVIYAEGNKPAATVTYDSIETTFELCIGSSCASGYITLYRI